jgi:protein TonB
MRVAIGRDGQVIGCDIMTSSGAAALDATACRLYAARARYVPGRNEKGEAVCDVAWTEARWNPAFAGRPPDPPGTHPPPARLPRPLREQLNARLCPGWPAAEGPAAAPAPPVPEIHRYPASSAPPPRPPRRNTPPERARANLNSYFSLDDYPPAARRANAQGTTEVRMTIGTNGRVVACEVASSSGSAALDAATCSILQQRAHYSPATDATGNLVIGTDYGRVTWRVPAQWPR